MIANNFGPFDNQAWYIQLFSSKFENGININIFFIQSQYYARADVTLPGFSKFFSAASKEERDHAEKLMDYINQRGGEVKLQDVKVRTRK